MTESHRLARADGETEDRHAQSGKPGEDLRDRVLAEVRQAERLGIRITIWDLPRVAGIPLHQAFAAVRTLESSRQLRVGDNPADPFGAVLCIAEDGNEHLRGRRSGGDDN